MRISATIACTAAALVAAGPAFAATDYLLEIAGIDGEAGSSLPLESWSFGVCNTGQCSTTSTKREAAPGKRITSIQASQNGQSLRESPTRPAAAAQLGDVDGDGTPDLAFAATQDAIYDLSWTVDATGPTIARLCQGKHIAKATLRRGDEAFEISDAQISCSSQPSQPQQRAGINRIDSTPARISTNLTVGKQTQQSSFGERCQAGPACGSAMTITVTSGQMKHTKTGHVTLLK